MTSAGSTSSSRRSSSSMCSLMSFSTSRRTGEPNRRRANSAQRLQQVFVAILVDLEIGVAGDSGTRDARRSPCRGTVDSGWPRSVPRGARTRRRGGRPRCWVGPRWRRGGRRARNRETLSGTLTREMLGSVSTVADGDGQVQAQPAYVGERVGRVDGERREDREDLLVEEGQ